MISGKQLFNQTMLWFMWWRLVPLLLCLTAVLFGLFIFCIVVQAGWPMWFFWPGILVALWQVDSDILWAWYCVYYPELVMKDYIREVGGRELVTTELAKVAPAVLEVMDNLTHPANIYVTLEGKEIAYVMGDYVFITRKALAGNFAQVLLVYSLIRHNQGDGRIWAGLETFGRKQREMPRMLRPFWREWHRQQVFNADQWTADFGFGPQLMEFIKYHEPFDQPQTKEDQAEPTYTERLAELIDYMNT